MGSTRREFLRNGWKLGGALLGVAAGWTTYESLRPLAIPAAGANIQLGKIDSFAAETATYIPAGRLFVANTGTRLFALSQKCPHLGCRIPFCESSGHFECPCHGSKYDIGGEWIQGPAPQAWTATPDDRRRHARRRHRRSERSRRCQYFKPAKGPSCAPKV